MNEYSFSEFIDFYAHNIRYNMKPLINQNVKGNMGQVMEVRLSCYLFSPDSQVHGASMGPTWVLSAPGGPLDGPTNLLSGFFISW